MRKGFTLVELLVVMAILSVIIASATFSYNRAQREANIAKAQSVVNELTTKIQAFAIDPKYEDKVDSVYSQLNGPAHRDKLADVVGDGSGIEFERNGVCRDPWGTPYEIRIEEPQDTSSVLDGGMGANNIRMSVYVPNMNQESDEADNEEAN